MGQMKSIALLVALVGLTGCASSTTVPLAADTVQITSSAAPVCGNQGAKRVAVQQAAIETIKRGFDKFIVLDTAYQNNVGVVGYTPTIAHSNSTVSGNIYGNTYSGYGHTTTTLSGGSPIIAGSHDQGLTIKMFKVGDPNGNNAVNARQTLGPEWRKMVQSGGPRTC
jgi:hypothetical protein